MTLLDCSGAPLATTTPRTSSQGLTMALKPARLSGRLAALPPTQW